MISATSLFSPL